VSGAIAIRFSHQTSRSFADFSLLNSEFIRKEINVRFMLDKVALGTFMLDKVAWHIYAEQSGTWHIYAGQSGVAHLC